MLRSWAMIAMEQTRQGKSGTKRNHMAADDEDLPVKYLLYVVAVIIVIAVAAVSTFMIFLR